MTGWVRLGTVDRKVVGLICEDRLPATVQGVADVLGYRSKAHVHESLVRLRAAGLIDWEDGRQATIRRPVRRVA